MVKTPSINSLAQANGISRQVLAYRRKLNPDAPMNELVYPPRSRSVRSFNFIGDTEQYTVTELARAYNVPRRTLDTRITRNPDALIEDLLYPPCATPHRVLKRYIAKDLQPEVVKPKKPRRKPNPRPDPPPFSEDYETLNRIRSYRKAGMSEDEIMFKLKMISRWDKTPSPYADYLF